MQSSYVSNEEQNATQFIAMHPFLCRRRFSRQNQNHMTGKLQAGLILNTAGFHRN